MKKLSKVLKNVGVKIRQFFCRHRETEHVLEKKSIFSCISGDRVNVVCKRCGKVVGSIFYEHEGNGYK